MSGAGGSGGAGGAGRAEIFQYEHKDVVYGLAWSVSQKAVICVVCGVGIDAIKAVTACSMHRATSYLSAGFCILLEGSLMTRLSHPIKTLFFV